MTFFAFNAALLLAMAAWLALRGTNKQAGLARARWARDPDIRVAQAVTTWRPGPQWIWGSTRRANWQRIQADLHADPTVYARFTDLVGDLWAWNNLESAVALAFVGSILGAVVAAFAVVW